MSQPQLSDLVKLAKSQKVKERRNAYKRMAASRDPQTIPYLRHAYLNDEDESVRDIAFDGLANFKAMQQGLTARRSLISDSVLRKLAIFLTITLVLSLILNGARLLMGDDGDSANPTQVAQSGPTDREALVSRIQDRLNEATAFSGMLRSEIANYTTNAEVACNLETLTPQAIQLALVDQLTYRDLSIVGSKLDAAIGNLDVAQFQWRHSCRLPEPDVADVLGASTALDQADIQIQEVGNLLQRAIDDPAPTAIPTMTPDPLAVQVASPTPEPPTAFSTDSAVTVPAESAPPTTAPTLPPDSALPYPNLDYTAILSSLSRQVAVMGDLQNQYNSGMLDQWRQAQSSSEPSSTSGCVFDPWPSAFAPSAEQQAQLNRTDVADPSLVEAIRLVQEGMTAAAQARVLFERDCPTGSLANSAAEGIPLAEGAYNRLATARDILDTIRQRPSTP